ncbi:S1 family peptidase [Pseudemcibacter aquimaris]|uniref:S1 family peptidase n=1 Tax=Pseudemcibacter aquimaris TaxID=2857064 RepID=UPI0020114B41|nr:serine protease [Pseudemcibacter aquimaris]MCC3859658.1 serine protease [Pseudemcibacter aquimaris]WDU60053.1 serine protease [Pseudemcibacter aquimaris]
MRSFLSFLILFIVVAIGEFSKDPDYKKPRVAPPPAGGPSAPPMPDINPEGRGELEPPSAFDPTIEIAEDVKRPSAQYTGTAFSIDNRGLWVTAKHVTHGCDQLMLLRPHRRALNVEALSEHRRADVAILRTDGGYGAFPVNYETPEYDQEGFHFGFPRGEPGDVYSKLIGRRIIKTTGINRGKEPVLVWAEKIRVPDSNESLGGISGGPILNSDGSVVGVHIAGSVRRGRSFSSLPRTINQLLDQNDITLNNQLSTPPKSMLNQSDFDDLGDDLRKNLQVAQVICRTN